MVSTGALMSKSLSLPNNPWEIVPSAPITIGITDIIMFLSFLCSLARSRCLSLFSLSFNVTLRSAGMEESTILQVLFFLLTISRCPWCNGYRRRKWTRRNEFKSWTRLISFHIALIPLGKVWIQLFSLQLWVNSRTD